ncbi:MAG: flagellar type III secretion system pore protein FliP [Phycisphaeraceae bacterium]|nr:flagellar type III secretion system pore protein FliP [Phycisphaeraceae bacterium]
MAGVGQFVDRIGRASASPTQVHAQAAAEGAEGFGFETFPGAEGEPAAAEADQGYSATISVMLIMTVLTLAPALLILCTSFTRIIIVLALLRQAIGTQSLPPSQIIVGLAFLLTLMIMAPTFEEINREAIVPLTENRITEQEAWEAAKEPIRRFMFAQIAHAGNWDDVYMILNYRGIDTSDPSRLTEDDVDMLTLVPAFVLSELKTAFLMGFMLYLPFLVIDMVIASVLISMGMMMLPPVLISLPFKLLMFVMVDGWRLVTGNLINSFAIPGMTATGVG